MKTGKFVWVPDEGLLEEVDQLLHRYRKSVREELDVLVREYCPRLLGDNEIEFNKMCELATKMVLVGYACSKSAGLSFNKHRLKTSILIGATCFMADSFVDDYGEQIAHDYVRRFELLLTEGWFEVRNDRERLFYVMISRLFAQRNVLDPMVRQSMFSLFLAQSRDIMIRPGASTFRLLPRRKQCRILRQCARDRSGQGILVLSHFLVANMPLMYHHLFFSAGLLIACTDDHGDCYADRECKRITYMNELRRPVPVLSSIYNSTVRRLRSGLPRNKGTAVMCAFLYRYFITRIEKHNREKNRGGLSWTVYE